MNSKTEKVLERQTLYKKLTDARVSILTQYPFLGSLVMHLKLSFAQVETAATDMRRIIWDPRFLSRLSLEEVEFIMMHEIMHCVLKHCIRGKELDNFIYNLACDIVVNSTIMHYMNVKSLLVDGEEVMHETPIGTEGYEHTTEQVYDMLVKSRSFKSSDDGQGVGFGGLDTDKNSIDNHNVWNSVSGKDKYLEEQWKEQLIEAVKRSGGYMPQSSSIRNLVEEYEYQSRVDWKTVLHDFIQVVHDKRDYSFSPYDRRFAEFDCMLPAFHELETEKVSNLWFVVDASGSMSDEMLGLVISEIKASVDQFDSLSGKISFFDTMVSEPMEFSDEIKLPSGAITGGGGTSFYSIFHYMEQHMLDELPTAVIVLTDGLAQYPQQDMALDVPVLWLLLDNEQDAPWGTSTHIES